MQMNTTITFELESNIREQLAAICARYNLSLEEAFTLFAEAVVQAGRFPYDMEVPNAVTHGSLYGPRIPQYIPACPAAPVPPAGYIY